MKKYICYTSLFTLLFLLISNNSSADDCDRDKTVDCVVVTAQKKSNDDAQAAAEKARQVWLLQQALADAARIKGQEDARRAKEEAAKKEQQEAAAAKAKAEHEQFCRSQPGEMLSTKTGCELRASKRDEARQDSCWNISLSWNGFGWTNPCRTESALTYRTDLAVCADDYQKNINSYNVICSK